MRFRNPLLNEKPPLLIVLIAQFGCDNPSFYQSPFCFSAFSSLHYRNIKQVRVSLTLNHHVVF